MSKSIEALLSDEKRDALELSADENADLCSGCSRCCESVSIEVGVREPTLLEEHPGAAKTALRCTSS